MKILKNFSVKANKTLEDHLNITLNDPIIVHHRVEGWKRCWGEISGVIKKLNSANIQESPTVLGES